MNCKKKSLCTFKGNICVSSLFLHKEITGDVMEHLDQTQPNNSTIANYEK